MYDTTKSKATIPIECEACHKMIEVGKAVVNHHVSYFPEKTIKVHGRCHGLIHKARSDYPDLKPNPSQVIRWYKKKGVVPWYDHINVHVWPWLSWIDCVENGFMTEERKQRIIQENVVKYWDECYRIQKFRDTITIDWDSSIILGW